MNHFIPLEEAVQMTTLYRDYRELVLKDDYRNLDLLPICETFDRAAFDTLLAKSGCAGLRVYYGMSEDLKVHAVITAVNADGEDMLRTATVNDGIATLTEAGTTEEDILEHANRCPDICPPDSPLNTEPAP